MELQIPDPTIYRLQNLPIVRVIYWFYPEYKVTYVSLDVKKATINLYYILVNYLEEDTVSQFTFIFTL